MKATIPVDFSERLATAFNSKENITWQELNRAVGCDPKTFDGIKRGLLPPSESCIRKMSDFLDVPFEYLKGEKAWSPNIPEPKKRHFSPRRLRNLLEKKGMKQKDLAAIMGVHFDSISKYCLGRVEPNDSTIRDMARALGVKKDKLLVFNEETEFKKTTPKKLEQVRPTKLLRLRETMGVMQKDLASYLGIGAPVLSRWERGHENIPKKHLAKLCELFGVSVEEVTGYADEETIVRAKETPVVTEVCVADTAPVAVQETDIPVIAEEPVYEEAETEAPVQQTDIAATLSLINEMLCADDPGRCGKVTFLLQTIQGLDEKDLDKICDYAEMVASFASR